MVNEGGAAGMIMVDAQKMCEEVQRPKTSLWDGLKSLIFN